MNILSIRLILLFSLWMEGMFYAVPALDLAVSRFFYDPAQGFWLAKAPALQMLRWIGWNWGLFLAALMGAMTLLSAQRRAVWGYGLLALALGPGLLVNGVFKSLWGRARPYQIIDFGGSAHYSAPMQIVSECVSNCSFTSGEGALAVTTAIVLARLLGHDLSPQGRRWLYLALFGYAVTLSGLRIAFGGHFLSDTIFSALVCGMICLALARLTVFRHAYARHAELVRDLRAPFVWLRTRLLPPAG